MWGGQEQVYVGYGGGERMAERDSELAPFNPPCHNPHHDSLFLTTLAPFAPQAAATRTCRGEKAHLLCII